MREKRKRRDQVLILENSCIRPDEDLVMMIVVMDVYVLYLFIT